MPYARLIHGTLRRQSARSEHAWPRLRERATKGDALLRRVAQPEEPKRRPSRRHESRRPGEEHRRGSSSSGAKVVALAKGHTARKLSAHDASTNRAHSANREPANTQTMKREDAQRHTATQPQIIHSKTKANINEGPACTTRRCCRPALPSSLATRRATRRWHCLGSGGSLPYRGLAIVASGLVRSGSSLELLLRGCTSHFLPLPPSFTPQSFASTTPCGQTRPPIGGSWHHLPPRRSNAPALPRDKVV